MSMSYDLTVRLQQLETRIAALWASHGALIGRYTRDPALELSREEEDRLDELEALEAERDCLQSHLEDAAAEAAAQPLIDPAPLSESDQIRLTFDLR